MNKKIDFSKTVFELTQEYPELITPIRDKQGLFLS